MTTIQAPQHRTGTRAAPHWYPIPLQLHYKATSRLGTRQGFGQTTMMSSQEIIFAPGVGLEPGMEAEVALAWPSLLDNRIRLQLVLQVMITGSQEGVAEARILAYDFRTAGLAEALRFDPDGMKNRSPSPDAASLPPRETTTAHLGPGGDILPPAHGLPV